MKKLAAILIVACLAVLGAGPLMLKSSADHSGFTLLTTPDNPYGWSSQITASSGPVTGSVEYTGGPRVPKAQGEGDVEPHGGGSLTLRTGLNADTISRARHPYLDGASVAGVDIHYSWIAADRPGNSAAPSLALTVRNPNTNDRSRLIYEPYFNQTTTEGVWDRTDAGAGKWWLSGKPPVTADDLFTLADYGTRINPGAVVVSDQAGGGFSVFVGGGGEEWPNFVGAVDDVRLKRDSANAPTNFNFEPTVLTVFPGVLHGWTFAATAGGGTVAPSATVVEGPGDPFFGTGSLQLAVGDNGDSRVEAKSPDFDGRTVAGIDALAYGTYVLRRPSAGSGGCSEAPYLRLDVIRGANAAQTRQTLYFHPCENATPANEVPLTTWQRWDAANGKWRWQESVAAARATARTAGATCDDTKQTCKGTLDQYTATYGDSATVAPGGLILAAGGGNAANPNNSGAVTTPPDPSGTRWANFVGNADFLTQDHSATSGRDYDFEAQAPRPPATTTTTDPNAPPTSPTTSSGGGGTTSSTVQRNTTTTTPGSGTSTSTSTTQPGGEPSASVRRIQGADRFDTAIEISRASFSDDGAAAVVLARGDDYPDALAATPLAVNRRGPLLLTWPSDLEPRVENEIRRVLPNGGTVHIAGGPVAVGPGVEARLKADGFNVLRHNGRNRFETATLIAEQITGPRIAFLATGTNFADALPSGAAAGSEAGVVVLTSGESMPPETAAYLQARPGLRRVAVGGQAAAAAPEAEPIVGNDRFETAVAVARRFFPNETAAAVANGTHYADALAGGPHIGARGGPLLLTRVESLPQTVRQWLIDHRSSLRNVYIYGGPNAVSANTQSEIRTATS